MDKLKVHLKELYAQRAVINKGVLETEQALAECACPFNVGDVVLNDMGEKEVVALISYIGASPFYTLSAFKLKKCGEKYKHHCRVYYPEKYSLA